MEDRWPTIGTFLTVSRDLKFFYMLLIWFDLISSALAYRYRRLSSPARIFASSIILNLSGRINRGMNSTGMCRFGIVRRPWVANTSSMSQFGTGVTAAACTYDFFIDLTPRLRDSVFTGARFAISPFMSILSSSGLES